MNSINLMGFYDNISFFECPICREAMTLKGYSLICSNKHCFDISKHGYVNFLINAKTHANYSKQSFQNRHFILENGMYEHILDEIIRFISNMSSIRNILDVGCGEGYYSIGVHQRIKRNFFAFDLSKDSIQIASKLDKNGLIKWFVADLSNIPLRRESIDCIMDIFSPANYKEFERILSPNGYIIKVVPTKNHLCEIREKAKIYLKNQEYSNYSVIKHFQNYFKIVSKKTASCTFHLTAEQRKAFIEMTPLLFHVGKDKIDWGSLNRLTIEAEILIGKY